MTDTGASAALLCLALIASCGGPRPPEHVSSVIIPAASRGVLPPVGPSPHRDTRVVELTLLDGAGARLDVADSDLAALSRCRDEASGAGVVAMRLELDAAGDLRAYEPLDSEEARPPGAVACVLVFVQGRASSGAWRRYAPGKVTLSVRFR